MDWADKTKREIEAELLIRMDICKANYEHFRIAQEKLIGLARDIEIGTPDGIVVARQANEGARALLDALNHYQAAIKVFTKFITDGVVPRD